MPLPTTHRLLAAGLGTALVAGLAIAGPVTASATPRDAAHGLLVLAVELPGNDQQYHSIDNSRGPFSGRQHDDLLDAIEQGVELDLDRFADDGRIALVDEGVCLGVADRTSPAQPRRAVAEPCVDGDADQQWEVQADNENRLHNVGSDLWVSNARGIAGWTMTGFASSSPYRVMTAYLDGRPAVTPRVTTTYDDTTNTVTLHGRNGTPSVPVTVSDGAGTERVVATSSAEGTFTAELPAALGNLAVVSVRFGDEDEWATTVRAAPVSNGRILRDADGTLALRGTASGYTTVSLATGPLAADVIDTATSSGTGGFRLPLPADAEPGDTFVVFQRADGVRTTLTVPESVEAVAAVDSPETTLVRGGSTPVPVGLVATHAFVNLRTEMTLTAPAGTVFSPGMTTVDGQIKPAGRDWQPIDLRLRLGDVTISPDGRQLTMTGTVDSIAFSEGDQIRWLPTLDVVDPALAPASV
ncbi:hypothetical protein [Curtobacterium sp. MCBA15_001]|uniref:hypothetical protein n=1 Tax=Curtobacterium sp. MCBA15_001 TaxID=1898731 RepID=UPI0008DDE881|nr:hypothetical protein [Curtobacterium sp. MCBA15_001]OIH95203.1 hypothetical protein BIU90_03490 [Curtobacterium sp. MCBA15_001]